LVFSLQDFLFNPVVPEEKKKAFVISLGQEAGFRQTTINFINLLVDKGRVDVLPEIVEAFEKEYCRLTDTQVCARLVAGATTGTPGCCPWTMRPSEGVVVQVATLRSAVKLEQEQQFLIAKKLQELTGSKNIKLKPIIDESLIAGFVVEYGSSQIDLSVKGQLEKITAELESLAAVA
jgi:F-type H+-transporting ATPase subunit delta